jgi:transcriptional regulator with XRE-family HTH domain
MQTRRLNGATVRCLREALGIRQGDLAARAAINPGFLTKLEQGSRQPSPAVLVKIASGLGVPLEAISYPVELSVAA